MNVRPIAACLLLLGTGHALADTLPLRHGAYVGVDTDCKDPPNAELRRYDGMSLGSSKAGDCRSRLLFRQGNVYEIEQDCRQYGGPKPERAPERATIRIDSLDRFTDLTHGDNGSFRRCPDLKP